MLLIEAIGACVWQLVCAFRRGEEFERTLVEGGAGLDVNCIPPGESLPPADGDIDVSGLELQTYARRPTRSAANTVVPEPQKVSSTISCRRVQSFIASATNATGLTVGCTESSSIRPARKLFTPA